MTIPDWLRWTMLGVQFAGLIYASILGFRARRYKREADAQLSDAQMIQAESNAQMERVGALLAHLMQQHGVLHTPHSHDDETPTVQ